MSDALMKLMSKKGADSEMDPMHKATKAAVLQQLMDEMTKMMGSGLSSAKKVTVAAPDSEGLKDGLAQAQELLGKGKDSDDQNDDDSSDDMASLLADDDADHEHEADDSDAADMASDDDSQDSDDQMDPKDIEAQIQKLQALLAAKSLK